MQSYTQLQNAHKYGKFDHFTNVPHLKTQVLNSIFAFTNRDILSPLHPIGFKIEILNLYTNHCLSGILESESY